MSCVEVISHVKIDASYCDNVSFFIANKRGSRLEGSAVLGRGFIVVLIHCFTFFLVKRLDNQISQRPSGFTPSYVADNIPNGVLQIGQIMDDHLNGTEKGIDNGVSNLFKGLKKEYCFLHILDVPVSVLSRLT